MSKVLPLWRLECFCYVTEKLGNLTLVKQSKSLCLVGTVWEEVEYDKVARDVDELPRRTAPVEPCHHLVGVAVQQLHHVRLVGDVEEGEVEEDGEGSRYLDGPVANTARPVLVWEVRGVDHARWRWVVPSAGANSRWRREQKNEESLVSYTHSWSLDTKLDEITLRYIWCIKVSSCYSLW